MLQFKYLLILACVSVKSFGYFDFQVQTCKQTGGNKSLIDYTDLKVRKVGGERKLFGNVTFHIPMDNSFDVEGYAYMKQGGEYRRLPFKIVKKKFCDFFVEEKLFYPDFVKVSDFPPPDITLCPLKNKTYHIRGYKPSLDLVPKAILNSGDYANELVFYKGSKVIFKGRCYVSIVNL